MYNFQVVIYAEDNGIPEKKRGYCTVVIKIIDVNDWPPVFDPVTVLSVNENAPVGFVVGKLTATDRDTGDNAFVQYGLTGNEELPHCTGAAVTVLGEQTASCVSSTNPFPQEPRSFTCGSFGILLIYAHTAFRLTEWELILQQLRVAALFIILPILLKISF